MMTSVNAWKETVNVIKWQRVIRPFHSHLNILLHRWFEGLQYVHTVCVDPKSVIGLAFRSKVSRFSLLYYLAVWAAAENSVDNRRQQRQPWVKFLLLLLTSTPATFTHIPVLHSCTAHAITLTFSTLVSNMDVLLMPFVPAAAEKLFKAWGWHVKVKKKKQACSTRCFLKQILISSCLTHTNTPEEHKLK